MRQLGDLCVWFLVVAVVAGVIYFTPQIIQQVSNPGPVTYTPHVHVKNCAICFQSAQELP